MAVIFHDPITKKAALAHVDRFTDTQSLQEVIKQFPEGTKLDTYLVGGRDRNLEGKLVSDDNIARVMGELQKHATINIKSADIGDKGAPSGIVFDPQTARLTHAVPGKQDRTTDSRKLLHNVATQPSLNFAFDLTKSQEMNPPKFTDLDKQNLVLRYLNTAKSNNAQEAWNANQLYDPLAKTVEKIRKENPEIVESAVKQHLKDRATQNPKITGKEQVKLLAEVEKSLKDPKKTLFAIDQGLDAKLTKPGFWKKITGKIRAEVRDAWNVIRGKNTQPSTVVQEPKNITIQNQSKPIVNKAEIQQIGNTLKQNSMKSNEVTNNPPYNNQKKQMLGK